MDTKQLKQKILDLAIRGKLVPQDPNDEPASVLLERIRKEKEQLIATGKLKKSKSKTTDTPHYENVPFEIPDSWEWVRLEDVAEIARGGSPRPIKSYLTEDSNGINWIKIGDTEKGGKYINKCLQRIKPEGIRHSRFVHKGDFLLTNSMSFGRPYILNIEGCIHDGWLVISPIHGVYNKDLLYYFLSSQYAYNQFLEQASGTAVSNLNIDKVEDALFPIIPLEEQKRIVAEIERWFALIEEIETNKADLQEYVKQTKSKILSLAISGKLVPQDPNDEPAIELLKRINPHFVPCDTSHYENLPCGWQVTPMQKLCDLAEGEKQTGIDRIYLDVKYLRGKGEKVIAQNGKYVPAGSTMILVDGENSGEIFTTSIDGYQGSTFKLLDISEETYKPFILYVIKSYQKQFRENKVGSAIPHLNKKLFREIEVFVPPFEEQKRIVKKIDEIFETIDKITVEL